MSHRDPYKTGPGAINVPISVCGQVVQPGDVLVGDEDGVVSFPAGAAADLIAAACRSAAQESEIRIEIGNGRVEQSWLRRVLDPHGL